MNWPVEVTYTDSVTFGTELVASTLSCLFETVYSARLIETTSGTGVAVRVGVLVAAGGRVGVGVLVAPGGMVAVGVGGGEVAPLRFHRPPIPPAQPFSA